MGKQIRSSAGRLIDVIPIRTHSKTRHLGVDCRCRRSGGRTALGREATMATRVNTSSVATRNSIDRHSKRWAGTVTASKESRMSGVSGTKAITFRSTLYELDLLDTYSLHIQSCQHLEGRQAGQERSEFDTWHPLKGILETLSDEPIDHCTCTFALSAEEQY